MAPDEGQEDIALREREHEGRMTVGDFLRQFETLAEQDEPFRYPLVYLKPRR